MMSSRKELARPFAEAGSERPATGEARDEDPAGSLLVEADHRDARALRKRAPRRERRPRRASASRAAVRVDAVARPGRGRKRAATRTGSPAAARRGEHGLLRDPGRRGPAGHDRDGQKAIPTAMAACGRRHAGGRGRGFRPRLRV